MSGSLTPALASLSTVMTASLSLGSIQKKSVPMVEVSLALVTLALGRRGIGPEAGLFSDGVPHGMNALDHAGLAKEVFMGVPCFVPVVFVKLLVDEQGRQLVRSGVGDASMISCGLWSHDMCAGPVCAPFFAFDLEGGSWSVAERLRRHRHLKQEVLVRAQR